ncbi:uncharacterized protein LOC132195655 isoform X2 [Neocloeon triangulifer]|uniref:uncharacterized protein LOC132195655 isoform X2 n=1 Tax=Neocloeon triangulifer TaxID=2078957 RepID=UPI00286EDCAD|nr:uncharacterized protein LOC132195655 isoform X2 [Neocloeon triangulifer]
MSFPGTRFLSRILLFSHRNTGNKPLRICQVKYCVTNEAAVAKKKWDLVSSVCVERPPVISADLTELEERMQSMLCKIELQQSIKSNHELRKEKDKVTLEALKSGNASEADLEQATKATAQDFEDSSLDELANFTLASRKNGCAIAYCTADLINIVILIPWQKIADRFPGKSVKQVAQRWTQRLDPKIKSGGFTERDDMIITAARSQKMTFMQIPNLMPGRTESQIRIRYTRLECFKPSVPWIPEDDQKLLALAKQFKGSRDQWSIVNEYFPDRDRQQLKGRHKRLLNDAAGIKNTLSRKGKRSIWVLNKRRTTPIRKKIRLIFSFKARKVGRRRKKKDDRDLELDQVYRSHYRQRRGRKRKYYPNTAKPATVNVAWNLCEIFGVHFDWNCEQRLLKAAATNPKFYNILNVYRQLQMLHYEEGWDCEKKHVTQSILPNVRSLVGLRT